MAGEGTNEEEPRKNSEEFPKFTTVFQRHIANGTRPGRQAGGHKVPWDAVTLSAGLDDVMGKGKSPDIRTVRNWLTSHDIPQERHFLSILTVLFGAESALAEQRTDLHDLWRLARQGLRPPVRSTPATRPERAAEVEPASVPDQWQVADAENIGLGLAALYVHLPPASNDPGSFLLQVSLSLAQAPGRDNEYWPTCADEFWPTPGVVDLLSRA